MVNLHRERSLIIPCLNSLRMALSRARSSGVQAETIVVIDRPDAATELTAKRLLTSWEGPVRIIDSNSGDLASARNAGIAAAVGTFVALADGDDLYSANWLDRAVYQARLAPHPERAVIHPAAAFFFGADYRILWSADSAELMMLGIDGLMRDNFWISTMLTSRELLVSFPFTPRVPGLYGFEDWSWYLAREVDGVSHRKAHGTVHCVRLKPPTRSLNKESAVLGEIPHPNGFLEEMLRRLEAMPESLDIVPNGDDAGDPKAERRSGWLLRRLGPRAVREATASPVGSILRAANGATMPSWDEERYIRENPDVAEALNRGEFTSGLSHYAKYGWREQRRAFMLGEADFLTDSEREACPEMSQQTFVPVWVTRTLDRLAQLEPLLSAQLRQPPWLWNPHRHSGSARDLWNLAQELRGIDTVILVPFLGLGGADLAAVQLAEGVAACGLATAVLATEGAISDARRAQLQEHGILALEAADVPRDAMGARALGQLLASAGIRWLHVLNSSLGWDAIGQVNALTGPAVSVSLFCYDFDPSGRPVGYLSRFHDVVKNVTSVATDNSVIGPYLKEVLGYPLAQVVKLRHRTQGGEAFSGPSRSRRVLWAGRLDRQKNLPRLLAVAMQLPHLQFDVYGSSVTDGTDTGIEDWPENVNYRGPFERFCQIPRDYGVFLYTSLWDGLPNILLEAAQCGIPIIAPRVGGIGIDLPARWIATYSQVATPAEIAGLVENVLEQSDEWEQKALRMRDFVLEEYSDQSALGDVRLLAQVMGFVQ